ncbi:MAG: hypothetical protein U0401_13230 [Anaerolineae bacterium]
MPWYLAEAFYRRLLEAVNYFGGREETRQWIGLDPYLPRKQAELASPVPWQVLAAPWRMLLMAQPIV